MNPIKYIFIGLKVIIKTIYSMIYHIIYGIIIAITIIPKYFIIGISCLFNEKKQKQLKIEDKIIPSIIITLSLTTYLLSIFLLTRWYVQNERNKKFAKDLEKQTEILPQNEPKQNTSSNYQNLTKKNNNQYHYPDDLSYLNVNLNYYKKINPQTVAWIQVNGTNINYPVVKTNNNSYYLSHDFYKRKTSIGWVFADYRDNFDPYNSNTIIYAHNLINRTMFGQLPYLLKERWQSNPNYHYIKLSTYKTNTIWQIFSVYKITPTTDYLQSNFYSEQTYENFLNTIKNRSSYNFQTEITSQDKIITLSTCDDTGNKRVAVHAKLIKMETK